MPGWCSRSARRPASRPTRTLASASLLTVGLSGGSAFVGFVEPKPSMPGLRVAACAPLALWACAAGPLSRLKGLAAVSAQVVAVLVPLAVALAWVIVREGAGEGDGY